MKFKRVVSGILSITLALPCFSLLASAVENDDTEGLTEVKTELSTEIVVKGGAKAVVSMTYDDGNYDTAIWMNEMFAKYGLKASCMLIVKNHISTKEKWQAVFDEGYLTPENHSMTHMVLPAPGWSDGTHYYEDRAANNTAENFQYELIDSKTTLEELFGVPNLTFAPSNNTLWWEAVNIVKENYYAMRQGTRANSNNTVQSLSPTEGSDEKGGWYNPYMYGIDNTTLEKDKSWVQRCIDEGGWFISMTHAVVNDPEKTERFEQFYQFLSEKQRSGDIWVAGFSEATIYLRERQNSVSSAYMTDEGVFVSVKMSDTTGDGLPLSESIFNMPLTVKVEVPRDWGMVTYELDGQTQYASSFTENSKRYAYVDVAPNSTDVALKAIEIVNVSKNANIAGYITADGGFTSGDMVISSYADKFRVDENVKVYAKLSLADFSENKSTVLPIKVSEDIYGELEIYGISSPQLSSGWRADTINPYNAPACDIFGSVTDDAVFITSVDISGAETYLVDISSYIQEMSLMSAEYATLIITLSQSSYSKRISFEFGTAEDVPEGSGDATDFVPYTFSQSFESSASGRGGFITGGIGSDQGSSFAVGDAENYLGESTRCIYWDSANTYERVFLGNVLSSTDTLTEDDLGSVYRISFRFKAEAAGKFTVWLGNSATKALTPKGSDENVYTFYVKEEDVGKWKKYVCTFTIDKYNLEADASNGAQNVSFAITPNTFSQTTSSRVMLYLDDIVSSKVNMGAMSAMIPTEYKALSSKDSTLFVSTEKCVSENLRYAYISFAASDISSELGSVLRLNIKASSGQSIRIYGLLDASVSEQMRFEDAPGFKEGKIDTAAVFAGVPLYEGAAECGILSLDITEYAKTQGESCVFLIVTDDISERELLYFDFESIPVSEGYDVSSDGSFVIENAAASASGALEFHNIFRQAVMGERYMISADASSGVTLTSGGVSAVSDENGKVRLEVLYDGNVSSAVFSSDSRFTVDNLKVELVSSPVIIAEDSDALVTLSASYDFSVIDPHVSMRLASTFELCFYINKIDDLCEASYGGHHFGREELANVPVAELDGEEYYVFAVPFSPENVERSITVEIGVMTKEGYVITREYSHIPNDYINTILSGEEYEDERSLILDMISYIRAYLKANDTETELVERLNELLYNRVYFDASNMASNTERLSPKSDIIESVSVDTSEGGYKVSFTPAQGCSSEDGRHRFILDGFIYSAECGEDGTYTLTLPLHMAAKDITIIYTDAEGNEKTTAYNINYSIMKERNTYRKELLQRIARLVESAVSYDKR